MELLPFYERKHHKVTEEQKQAVKLYLAVTFIHTFFKLLHIDDSQIQAGKLESICFFTIKNKHDQEVELTSKHLLTNDKFLLIYIFLSGFSLSFT